MEYVLFVKTIGVIGGIGPQATMDFEQRVHRACQALVPQSVNSGYPPMVVYYCRFEPWAGRNGDERDRPNPRLVEAARDVVSMIDAVLAHVREREYARLGLLGFGEPLIYMEQLDRVGTPYETI